MNRYRELLGSVEPPEGFEHRLSDAVLSFTPASKRPYRPRTALQVVVIILLIAVALMVTAGATYIALNWDPIFMKRFSPTESQASQLNAVQSAPIVSECGDVTLTVRQTLGDDKTIYVILDITLPETVPLDALLGVDAFGNPDLNIIPEDIHVGSAALSYEDVKGKSFKEYSEVRLLLGSFEGSGSVRSESVDFGTNTLTYLICCSPQRATLSEKPLTFLIDRLVQTSETPFKTILEGPFVISWTPEPNAASRTYEIKDGGYTRGWVTISPFTLKGELLTSDYHNLDELLDTVSLTFKNGETYLPVHKGVCGSFSSPSGNCDFDTQFSDILLLDEVVSIHMGGYTIKIN